MAQDLGLKPGPLTELEAVLKVGERLAQLAWVQKFFLETLDATLSFKTLPPKASESAYARLGTLVFRQQLQSSASGSSDIALDSKPLSSQEWTQGATHFDGERFRKSLDPIAPQAPAPAKDILSKRIHSLVEDVVYFAKSTPSKKPDSRFFKGLVFQEDK